MLYGSLPARRVVRLAGSSRVAFLGTHINGDGTVNVVDLIRLLLCFGEPAVPECVSEDVNNDGTVNVLDLIELLLAFGSTCPAAG